MHVLGILSKCYRISAYRAPRLLPDDTCHVVVYEWSMHVLGILSTVL